VKFSYSKHYRDHAEGHIFFDVDKGPCAIQLTGAASMSQEQLDQLGETIAKLLNSASPSHFSLLNK
jgi:hypothetical protein